VLDVLVAEVVLQEPRIDALVRQLVTAGMAQHVRVDRERHLGGFPKALDEPAEAHWAHRRSTLAHEHT
jgi:hypothetical protein